MKETSSKESRNKRRLHKRNAQQRKSRQGKVKRVDDMDKVKLALIGAGERGQFNYAPYWKLHSHEMSFVAVAEPDRKSVV